MAQGFLPNKAAGAQNAPTDRCITALVAVSSAGLSSPDRIYPYAAALTACCCLLCLLYGCQ